MSTALVIVESPAKAKTVNRYLGKEYKVLASYGHVRDLLAKDGAIDTDNDFAMQYRIIEKNTKHVELIARELGKADTLCLATDPDREGEAIAWHLHELLQARGILQNKQVQRIVFHEVTKEAIQEAMSHPRDLSTDLINAQQARRALDYLVGFNLSPLLWKKIHRGLSAGRVQSPALRMIAEREVEIENFKVREYWTITADLSHAGVGFKARLTHFNHKKLKQFSITKAKEAEAAKASLLQIANGHLTVSAVEKKQRKHQPLAPFITSSLQQEAVRKLGFTAQNTMRIAQQLYEGISTGGRSVGGLITYMRTDSVALARQAQAEIRHFIAKQYGKENLPATPRQYKTKAKNAQEAHEAIRPTSVQRTPEELTPLLDKNQFKLYQLIWQRTVASQMIHATIDTVAVDLHCGAGNTFRATGSTVAHPGFMSVYQEMRANQQTEDKKLPALARGDVIKLIEIEANKHLTEPPPRYTEASLIKTLEEFGIGRPSTYATIISILQQREYVEFEKKRFKPTEMGRIVNNFLTNHFTQYTDYDFTAQLEDELDAVSRGEKDWRLLMQDFWQPFVKQIQEKGETVSRAEAIQVRALGTEPDTGAPITVRVGRYGPYAQIGSKDDETKPRFAGLRPEQKPDTVTLEEVLELFKLPRVLGKTEADEEIAAGIGRYGPYIRYGKAYVSLPPVDDPYTVTLARAQALIAEKKNREIKVFAELGIRVLNGPYGPYVTDGKKNAKIPKDKVPAELTQEDCQKLIATAPKRGRRGKRRAAKTPGKKPSTAEKAQT